MSAELIVILADGEYPRSPQSLAVLEKANIVIACDGAAASLLAHEKMPDYVVGDLDSLSDQLRSKLISRLVKISEQETNDLNKAFRFAQKFATPKTKIVLLGATGKREDHTLGNIGLLAGFAQQGANIEMLTDTGTFRPVISSAVFSCRANQAVSIFNPNGCNVIVSARGLKYPVEHLELSQWWTATLNTTLGNEFSIEVENGPHPVLVFTVY